MCGICGIYSPGKPVDIHYRDAATRTLMHRGPDGLNTWTDPTGTVGLGHTRLAVIDLVTGQQPMASMDSRFLTVFNGEIYNYQDLRRQLKAHGFVFRTQSDTEVLLNAYERWGEHCLSRLDGMFAFAIFDNKDRKLFLARDRTGIKPLYYHQNSEGIVFGSELKALLKWPHVPRRVDRKAITEFLMLGYPLLPATSFQDCHELEPGTFLEVSPTNTRKGRYWTWAGEEGSWGGEDPLYSVEEALKAAVHDHLVSDVPIGAFLSGGIDSSLVVALAAANGGQKIQTFNVRFGEVEYDESQYARSVAAHVGTDHHEIAIEKNDTGLELIKAILTQFDQPFGDSSAIPTYLICREIRNHVKVVLGGDGGDEMFGGYERFAYADVATRMALCPQLALKTLESMVRHSPVVSPERRRQFARLLNVAQKPSQNRLQALCSIIQQDELERILQPDFLPFSRNGSHSCCFSAESGRAGGEELIDVTVKYALPGDYLRKIDVMSSAHGLEVRVPMLSSRILRLARHLPRRLKYSLLQNKILLRELAGKYLPAEIANKRKQGFGIPLDTWLGKSGRMELSSYLASPTARNRELLRPEYIQTLTDQFAHGGGDRSRISRYSVYQRAYALLGLENWLQRWKPSL